MGPVRIAGLVLSMAFSCTYDPLIGEPNEVPIADAKVVLNGAAVEQARDGSIATLLFPFTGAPVVVMLDGTASRDPDGEIVQYRWLSGTRVPDAGAPRPWSIEAGTPEPFWRSTPSGQEQPWPSAVSSPSVSLGQGTWTFTLWVADDRGAWSNPDVVRFVVGQPSQEGADAGAAIRALVSPDGGLDAGR